MAKKIEPKKVVSKPATTDAKLAALNSALQHIEKDYGKGAVMKLGDEQIEDVEVIPTGSIMLNHALGVGGYPKGRIIEIFGPESSGKTCVLFRSPSPRDAHESRMPECA